VKPVSFFLLLKLVSTNLFSILETQGLMCLRFHQQAADEVGGNLLGGGRRRIGRGARRVLVAMGVAL
jgi:hypothetical protein